MAFKYHVVEGKNLKTGAAMFFAMADPVDTVKLPEICEEVSHACTATEADVKAVLAEFQERILKHLQNNESVRLGTLGAFCPRIKSTSAASAELFTADNITRVGVQFTPSSKLLFALDAKNPEVKFERTLTE